MLKVCFFPVFPCFPILFQLEKLKSLHIFFSLPRYVLGIAAPQIALPGRAALVRSFLLAPWPQKLWKRPWNGKIIPVLHVGSLLVPIAHCCLSRLLLCWSDHRILFRKFQILLERPQPLVQLLRMVNCCWFRASHSLMLVISPF